MVVVIDQLASWALQKYLPYLPEEGAIRRGIARGAFHRVSYPFAGTFTAPGHTALFTGTPPAESGVMANELWSRARHVAVPCASDPASPVFGDPTSTASPVALRVPTVGDALWEATGGRSRVASLSMKDRAAVLSGGKHAELALFYDKSLPGFTTSAFYAKELPPWLQHWEASHPLSALMKVWTAGNPDLYARILGPDDARGEGDWKGFGRTFPHDPGRTAEPYATVVATPQSSEHLLALALEMVQELELGKDDTPDLLALSISGTDYVGHVFGPDSWESLDNLVRVDRALGTFVDEIATRTTASFLITSDHGVAPLPERSVDGGKSAGRLEEKALKEDLTAALAAEFGPGDFIEAVKAPFVYLTTEGRDPARRPRAVRRIQARLAEEPGVAIALDVAEILRRQGTTDPMKRAIALGVDDHADADVFFVPKPFYVIDPGIVPGAGTNHGTPWPYDREVPVIFWGPGVSHVTSTVPLDALRVAKTIAALLGIAAPLTAHGAALPGAPGSPSAAGER